MLKARNPAAKTPVKTPVKTTKTLQVAEAKQENDDLSKLLSRRPPSEEEEKESDLTAQVQNIANKLEPIKE
jgi:hypothetical protein